MVDTVQLIWLKWWDRKSTRIFFLGRNYSAQDAMDMGMVNAVIPHAELEDTAYEWAQEILQITDGYQNVEICYEFDR
jgi:1,4-dihydroxy-2-naphthoyl-CoA synthase